MDFIDFETEGSNDKVRLMDGLHSRFDLGYPFDQDPENDPFCQHVYNPKNINRRPNINKEVNKKGNSNKKNRKDIQRNLEKKDRTKINRKGVGRPTTKPSNKLLCNYKQQSYHSQIV